MIYNKALVWEASLRSLPTVFSLGLQMRNFFNAKLLPASWIKLLVALSAIGAFLYVITGGELFRILFEALIENLDSPSLYGWILFFIIIYIVINNVMWKEIKDWADYYDLEIKYVKSIDINEGKFSFTRLNRQEYRLGLENKNGEQGEMYIFFVYKQILAPYKQWLTQPLTSHTRGEIPNEMP